MPASNGCGRDTYKGAKLTVLQEEAWADMLLLDGNSPQAFTHLALISAAFDLDRRLSAAGHAG